MVSVSRPSSFVNAKTITSMNRLFRITLLTLIAAAAMPAHAIERSKLVSYAQSLKGKKEAELKTAIYNLTRNANTLNYGSGTNCTWWGFYVTDKDAEGYVIDRYSNNKVKFGSRGSAASGMNIEHSFPKSWWDGSKNQAYKDLYNLMPSESDANSSKSNYGMGIVTTVKFDNGCIKVGTGNGGMQLWQPAEVWKGDFSRGYMYMATAYQNLNYEGEGLKSLQNGDYPTLKEWAYTLYLKWMREDKVSQVEVDRNNAVAEIQGNRNLYVDFPTLAEYVWGDSINYEFDPDVALTTADGDERYAAYNPSEGGGNSGGGGGEGGDSGNEGGDGGEEVTPPVGGLLFNEPFDDITDGNNTSNSGSGSVWNGCDHFPSVTAAYQAGGAVKMGTGSKTGSITSAAIPFAGGTLCVSIDVKGWTTVEGELDVTLGNKKKTVEYSAKMSDAFETATLTFDNVPANPTLTIATTAKRAFVDNVKVWQPTGTGITTLTGTPQQTGNAFFSLSGQKLCTRPAAPGIYIYNGKKFVVK